MYTCSSVSFIISAYVSLKENVSMKKQRIKKTSSKDILCLNIELSRELRSSATRPSIRDMQRVFSLNSNACTWRSWLITPYSQLEGLRALPCIINQRLSYRKLRPSPHAYNAADRNYNLSWYQISITWRKYLCIYHNRPRIHTHTHAHMGARTVWRLL